MSFQVDEDPMVGSANHKDSTIESNGEEVDSAQEHVDSLTNAAAAETAASAEQEREHELLRGPAPEEVLEARPRLRAAPDRSEPDGTFPLADAGEYYAGLWSGIPNYKCPYCGYASIEGSGAVELHILARIEAGSKAHFPALEPKESNS